MMTERCQRFLDGFGLPAEWSLSIVVPIFKRKGDVRNCNCYGAVKKRWWKDVIKKFYGIVIVYKMQFGFMPERGTIDNVFILRRMQEEYHAKVKKMYMCFVDIEKAFDRDPRKVMELGMRKKEYQKYWLGQS